MTRAAGGHPPAAQLAAQARGAAAFAMRSARENAALARFATRLGAASDTSETAQIVCDEVRSILAVQTMILHGSGEGVKITAPGQTRPELSPVDRVPSWVSLAMPEKVMVSPSLNVAPSAGAVMVTLGGVLGVTVTEI